MSSKYKFADNDKLYFVNFPSLAQICSKGKSGVGVSVPIVCYLVKAILLFLQHE
jgi:hypothetical protein